MRCVIAGSRSITSYEIVCEAIKESRYDITVVISGRAWGVDLLGERWANEHGIPIETHKPIWRREDGSYNPGAGLIRNTKMAQVGDCGIIVWDGHSTGSRDMSEKLIKAGKPCFIYMYTTEEPESQEEKLWDMIYEV